jgi:hypothetical protein
MHNKALNEIDCRKSGNYSDQYKRSNFLDTPFIVSTELNFPFLINLKGKYENYRNHHLILTKRRRID